ncbi:MAG: NitrOD5 domain-containing protein [Candidatus Bathyarchaeales archaeon]
MKAKKGESDKSLVVALYASMENVFGKSAAKAVYHYLNKSYLLRPEEIPEKPQVFVKAIEEMFGERGAEVIEALLVKDLLAKLDVECQEKENNNLVDWLDKLKTIRSKKQ